MSDERRVHPRYVVWFPVHLDAGEAGQRVTVSRNLSQTGMLMASAEDFTVGSRVRVTFRGPADTEPRKLEGTIVRTSEGEDDRWPYRMAVEFEDPQPEIETLMEQAMKDEPPDEAG